MSNQPAKQKHHQAELVLPKGLVDVERLRLALRATPRDAHIALALAEALANANVRDPAGRAFDYALSIDPRLVNAHLGLGALRAKSGHAAGALAAFNQAHRLDPTSKAARHGLAEAFEALGFKLAARSYRSGAGRDSAALFDRAQGFAQIGLYEEAAAQLAKIRPPACDEPAVLFVRANVLVAQGKPEEAIGLYRRAVAAAPDFAEAWANLGNTLAIHGVLEDAEAALRRALNLRSDFKEAGQNLANVLMEAQRHDEALALLRTLIARWPTHPDLHANLANLLLLLGQYEEGWEAYEWRRHMPKVRPQMLDLPEWRGESLGGRPLHVMGEQGVGDTVMFATCMNELATVDGPVHLYSEARLVPLLARSFPFATVSVALPERPEGLVVPIGSLPRLFRRTAESFQLNQPFLRPDPAGLEHWRQRFATLGGKIRIGISWRGGADLVNKRLRTMQLDDWLPVLTMPGVVAIDLQYGDHDDELKRVHAAHAITLHRFNAEIDPKLQLDGFAAQLAALDLFISVDNSAVHLAGALGTPTLTLLPFAPNWRWRLEREACPWYPGSNRLIRQSRGEPWCGVVERAAAEVEAMITARRANPDRQTLPGQDGHRPADSAALLANAPIPESGVNPDPSMCSLVNGGHGTNLAP